MELTFTEQPGVREEDLHRAQEALDELVRRTVLGRTVLGSAGLPVVPRFEIRFGVRSTGGRSGVPMMRQRGFQVAALVEGDAPLQPVLFLDQDRVLDEPDLVEQILDLWMDRLFNG